MLICISWTSLRVHSTKFMFIAARKPLLRAYWCLLMRQQTNGLYSDSQQNNVTTTHWYQITIQDSTHNLLRFRKVLMAKVCRTPKGCKNVYSAIQWKVFWGRSWKWNAAWKRLQELPSINFTHSRVFSFNIFFSLCFCSNREALGQSTFPSDSSILFSSEFVVKSISQMFWFAVSFGSSQLLSWCGQVGQSMF